MHILSVCSYDIPSFLKSCKLLIINHKQVCVSTTVIFYALWARQITSVGVIECCHPLGKNRKACVLLNNNKKPVSIRFSDFSTTKYFVEKLLNILFKLKSTAKKLSFDNSISSHLQHHIFVVVLLHSPVEGCPFAVVSYIPGEVCKWHGFYHQSQMPPVLWSIHQHHSAAWPRVKFLCLSQWKPLKK